MACEMLPLCLAHNRTIAEMVGSPLATNVPIPTTRETQVSA